MIVFAPLAAVRRMRLPAAAIAAVPATTCSPPIAGVYSVPESASNILVSHPRVGSSEETTTSIFPSPSRSTTGSTHLRLPPLSGARTLLQRTSSVGGAAVAL